MGSPAVTGAAKVPSYVRDNRLYLHSSAAQRQRNSVQTFSDLVFQTRRSPPTGAAACIVIPLYRCRRRTCGVKLPYVLRPVLFRWLISNVPFRNPRNFEGGFLMTLTVLCNLFDTPHNTFGHCVNNRLLFCKFNTYKLLFEKIGLLYLRQRNGCVQKISVEYTVYFFKMSRWTCTRSLRTPWCSISGWKSTRYWNKYTSGVFINLK